MKRLITSMLLGTVLAAASLLLVGACEGPGEVFHEPKISNLRDETVEVYLVSGAIETRLATLAPRQTVGLSGYNNKCTVDLLVARTTNGEEIARRTEPICPDEVWTIDR
jgi:hypothetical protein